MSSELNNADLGSIPVMGNMAAFQAKVATNAKGDHWYEIIQYLQATINNARIEVQEL